MNMEYKKHIKINGLYFLGRGIELILSKEPNTKFEVIADMFIITFQRKKVIEFEKGSDKNNISLRKLSKKELLILLNNRVGSKLVERVGSKLVENQLRIILLVVEDGRISKKRMSEILKITTTAIDKNILKLKKLDIIRRVGPDKGGYWEIAKNIK